MHDRIYFRSVPAPVWRKRLAIILGLLAATVAVGAQEKAPPHPFAGPRGETINAEILQVKDGDVVVKRTDGKVFALDLPLMNEADRVYVWQWRSAVLSQAKAASATTDSDIEMGVQLEPLLTGGKAAEPGSFTPKVTLRNRETAANFSGLKCTLVLVGQSATRPARFKVLAAEQFPGELAAGATYVHTAAPFHEAAPGNAASQFAYRGYFIVLQNAEGNIIQLKRDGPFPKSGAEVLRMRPGAVFSTRPTGRAFRLSSTPRTTNGNRPRQTSVLPLHLKPPASGK
ncbi:MAG TPA: hypothetical protein VHC95_00660 [Opitutales bacterium]|nr:hypothetical protein [Opitutales bacterium]